MSEQKFKPQIVLPVEAVCCRAHGEPFRTDWPKGYLGFCLELATTAIETSDELKRATGGDVNKLNAVIAEFGPLCRLVDRKQRMAAYERGAEISKGWAQHGICQACSKFKKGRRGKFRARGGILLERLVCFECYAKAECQ